MEHAQRALFREYKDRAWVDALCGKDLWHEYEALIHLRTVDLREQLHVLVTAAAVTVDQGKAFEAMDETLQAQIKATGKARGKGGGRGDSDARDETVAPLNAAEQAEIAAMVAANEDLWGIPT